MPREGFVQESMMAALSKLNDLTLMELARIVYKAATPTKNQLRSAHKALDRLLKDGKVVESPYRDDKGKRCFSLAAGARKTTRSKLSVVK